MHAPTQDVQLGDVLRQAVRRDAGQVPHHVDAAGEATVDGVGVVMRSVYGSTVWLCRSFVNGGGRFVVRGGSGREFAPVDADAGAVKDAELLVLHAAAFVSPWLILPESRSKRGGKLADLRLAGVAEDASDRVSHSVLGACVSPRHVVFVHDQGCEAAARRASHKSSGRLPKREHNHSSESPAFRDAKSNPVIIF